MKKSIFILTALVMSIVAQAAVINAHPNGGEPNVLSWFLGQAQNGDTILLADGEYIQPYSLTFDKKDLVVMAAEGAKPVIALTDESGWATLNLNETITFDGVTFDGKGVTLYLLTSNGTAAGKFVIENCEFKDCAKWPISNQFNENTHVDSIIINNCLIHDSQAAVNFRKYGVDGQHACNYFELKNTTIYNINETEYLGVINVSSNGEATGDQNEVVIDHMTMYNYVADAYGAIAVRKSSNLTITNSIIANPAEGQKAFYIYGGNITNTLYFNATDDSDATYTNCLTVDPMFVDPANANFALAEGSPAIGAGTDGSNLGDPRWNASSETTAVENIKDNTISKKVIRNGQIFIIHDGEMFNILGQAIHD